MTNVTIIALMLCREPPARELLGILTLNFRWMEAFWMPDSVANDLEDAGLIEFEWVGYARRYRARRTPLAEQLLAEQLLSTVGEA